MEQGNSSGSSQEGLRDTSENKEVGKAMEQRKLLWIVLSIGIFVALVLGAGLVWFYPGGEQTATTSMEGAAAGDDFDAVEWVREDREMPGLEESEDREEQSDEMVIIIGENGKAKIADEQDSTELAEKEKAEQEEASSPAAKPEVHPQPESESADQPKAEPAAPPEKERAPEPETKTVRVKEYWIQAASYTSKFRAEQSKLKLEEQGLSARVVSKLVNNQTYFRVRIGPFSKKEEAEKFLMWVRDIDGYGESYVSVVYSTRQR